MKAFLIEKMIDTLKEFKILIKSNSVEIKSALNNVGLTSKDVENRDILDLFSHAFYILEDFENDEIRNEVGLTLFGSIWEDIQEPNPLHGVMGAKEASELWELGEGHVKNLCAKGAIPAKKIGNSWVIPTNYKYKGRK